MAFVPINQDDEEKKKLQQEGQPTQLASESGVVGADPGGAPTEEKKGGSQGSGFVDVNAYLNANQPQAMQTADAIGKQLGEQHGKIKSDVDTIESGFKSDVELGGVKPDKSLVDRAASNPSGFVQNQNDVAAFNKQKAGLYTGPAQIQNYKNFAEINRTVQDAARRSNIADTDEGRMELLQGLGQNLTKGQANLDNLLITGNKDARAKINAAAQPFSTLQDYLDQSTGRAAGYTTQAQKDAQAAKDYATSTIGKSAQDFRTDFDTRLNTTRDTSSTEAAALREALQNSLGQATPGISPAQAAQLGLTTTNWSGLKGMNYDLNRDYSSPSDLMSYFSGLSPESINAGNFASADDYAREAALQQLAGDEFDFLNNPDAATLAGTAPKSLASYDADKAWGDVYGSLTGKDKSWLQTNPKPAFTDAKQKQTAMNIMERNLAGLNVDQKAYYDKLQKELNHGVTPPADFNPPPPPLKPTLPDQNAAPKQGESRTRYIEGADGGKRMWWDGGAWIPAPAEYRNNNTERFNYDTGKYEPVPPGTPRPIVIGRPADPMPAVNPGPTPEELKKQELQKLVDSLIGGNKIKKKLIGRLF